jgi:hypothetical protein
MYVKSQDIEMIYKISASDQIKLCKKHKIKREKHRFEDRVWKAYSESEFVRLMQKAGFEIVRIDNQKFWSKKLYPLYPNEM